jgi:hypothetical protein
MPRATSELQSGGVSVRGWPGWVCLAGAWVCGWLRAVRVAAAIEPVKQMTPMRALIDAGGMSHYPHGWRGA